MKRSLALLALAGLAIASCGGPDPVAESPTAASTPSPAPASTVTVTVTPTPSVEPTTAEPSPPPPPAQPDATLDTLFSAWVPETTGMPAQQLVEGKATSSDAPLEGSLATNSVGDPKATRENVLYTQVDLAGLGYNQILAAYYIGQIGSSGQFSLLLVDNQGNTIAHISAQELNPGRTWPTTMEPTDAGVLVGWEASGPSGTGTALVTYSDGQLFAQPV